MPILNNLFNAVELVFFLPKKWGENEQEITIILRRVKGREGGREERREREFEGERSLKSDKENVKISRNKDHINIGRMLVCFRIPPQF
jgi:hypothetical protein